MLKNSDEIKPLPLAIVADNHSISRATLAALMSYDGYRVFQATSLTAMSCISNADNLAVLVIDLEMQGWRSIVRQATMTTNASIIAMEGEHPISEIYDLRQRGIAVCLQKPIVYNDLRMAISASINGQHHSEALLNQCALKIGQATVA
jgi:DNA-binding NtrC family response regulator